MNLGVCRLLSVAHNLSSSRPLLLAQEAILGHARLQEDLTQSRSTSSKVCVADYTIGQVKQTRYLGVAGRLKDDLRLSLAYYFRMPRSTVLRTATGPALPHRSSG